MSNLIEIDRWEGGIYQLETSDPVIGGPDGIDNLQAKQLANRTQFLKRSLEAGQSNLEAHASAVDPHPQYATKSDLAQRLAELVGQSPAALDTLNELAAALGNDPNFATTMTSALAQKASIDSPVLTGTPKGTTPPQFDNSTKLATMAAVQRALGNLQQSLVYGTSQTLAAATAGSWIAPSVVGLTFTLPLALSCPPGSAFWFYGNSYGLTVSAQGNDKLSLGASGALTNAAVGNFDRLVLVNIGQSGWYAIGGEAAMGASSAFAASLGTNGYQKLPGGLIIQWGTLYCGAVTSGGITYPLAFPTTALVMQICSYNDVHGTNETAWLTTSGSIKTTLTFGAANTNSASAVRWMAIGF
ncbi:gp53-like domain-containing protein [Burkholderia sp. F1]|uniref:gp53-like domain-containing protein n=1 Tax=Burkholderia sp. F1 TaxID=3366817 RepID=UPI003D71C83D